MDHLAPRDGLPMSVQFFGNQVLITGGKVAMDPGCCCQQPRDCDTNCGATCDSVTTAASVDVSGFAGCTGCNAPPTSISVSGGGDCSGVETWTGSDAGSGWSATIEFIPADGCYFLTLSCGGNDVWRGCKGGGTVAGTFTCADDGFGACEHNSQCNSTPDAVVVT